MVPAIVARYTSPAKGPIRNVEHKEGENVMTEKLGRASVAFAAAAIATTIAAGLPTRASAQSDENLRRRIEVMEQQLQDMKGMAKQLETLKQELAKTQKKASRAAKAASAEDTRAIKWHLAGFGTANYTATNASGENNSFGSGNFNPIFLLGYKDLLLWESELEFSTTTDGDTKTELEFSNANLMATDWLTLTVGKFLSPIGDFQQHLHPTWINKLPDRPAGFVEDGGNEPLSEVGVMARGAFPVGSMTLDYAVFAGNGPRLADTADGGVRMEGFGGDDNGNKAFGGRIGLRPLPYLSIGVSGMRSRIKGNAGSGGSVSQGDYDVEDIDAAFTKGNWDIRGEYIRSHLDSLTTALDPTSAPVLIPATTWHSWYAQAAYRLAGVTDNAVLRNVEPVVRYSQFDVSGLSDFEQNEEDRLSVGLDYWFAPSIVTKIAYENRDFSNKPNEDLVRIQLAFGF